MSAKGATLLPKRFDPETYADQNLKLTGMVPVKTMQRLQNLVISMQSLVAVSLQFSRNHFGRVTMTGQIKHSLELRCERCLDQVQITIDQSIEVLLQSSTESVIENTEKLEFYEYDDKGLELAEIIEDELLLALPLVPRHEDISLCDQDMVAWLASNEAPVDQAENPFAILKRQ